MEIILTPAAYADLAEWKKSGNKKVLQRIRDLIASIEKHLSKASANLNFLNMK
jgi:hypothetical protein